MGSGRVNAALGWLKAFHFIAVLQQCPTWNENGEGHVWIIAEDEVQWK